MTPPLETCERGSGRLVVAMHPATAFGPTTAELLATAAEARVVCATPAAAAPLEAMADRLEAWRQEQGLPRWTFWGLSGGGFLALVYAHRHPQALEGLVIESACACFRARLADPDCLLSPHHPAWASRLPPPPLATERDGWMTIEGLGWVYAPGGHPEVVSPLPVDERMRTEMPSLLAYDARPHLARIDVPTLVVHGEQDQITPRAHARAVVDAMPNARWCEIGGGGHVPSASGSAAAHAAVRDFLRSLPTGASPQ